MADSSGYVQAIARLEAGEHGETCSFIAFDGRIEELIYLVSYILYQSSWHCPGTTLNLYLNSHVFVSEYGLCFAQYLLTLFLD